MDKPKYELKEVITTNGGVPVDFEALAEQRTNFKNQRDQAQKEIDNIDAQFAELKGIFPDKIPPEIAQAFDVSAGMQVISEQKK